MLSLIDPAWRISMVTNRTLYREYWDLNTQTARNRGDPFFSVELHNRPLVLHLVITSFSSLTSGKKAISNVA
jgi:hypothetical protein